MNLEIDPHERDLLIIGLGQITATHVSGLREQAIELLKRLSRLEPDVPAMDVSVPNSIWCICRGRAPADEFRHAPDCEWVRRYG